LGSAPYDYSPIQISDKPGKLGINWVSELTKGYLYCWMAEKKKISASFCKNIMCNILFKRMIMVIIDRGCDYLLGFEDTRERKLG